MESSRTIYHLPFTDPHHQSRAVKYLSNCMDRQITEWEISYGDERGWMQVTVPHAWRQDMPVSWEGPARYRTRIEVPADSQNVLIFKGVSYEATVFIDGVQVYEHRGIWDGFVVPLREYEGKTVTVEVEVVKNGGKTFPVDQVASGFLPFVFNTFGGIYDTVVLQSRAKPKELAFLDPYFPEAPVRVEGRKIYVNDIPFYPRGILTWGWYPELGHTNPSLEQCREEVKRIKSLGFNLIKFCLWAPHENYIKALEEEGMAGWVELPIWDPTEDPEHQHRILAEASAVTNLYWRSENIILWTCGCELNTKVSWVSRKQLFELIGLATRSALVKDNSGGSEMYDGDPQEFGDYYDFHPYCDTHFYPEVLDSLLPGPREEMPLLLGEFNDCDVHRDLPRLAEQRPFWTSTDESLNAVGVRWQHDLPEVLETHDLAKNEIRSNVLAKPSLSKARFVRKFVQEQVRAREGISGYVITGIRDTPISSSGLFDDWGDMRFSPEDILAWNSPDCLFLIPQRRPPWVSGGNRPGWRSLFSHFVGDFFIKIGLHSERGVEGSLEWSIEDVSEKEVAQGKARIHEVPELSAREVAEVSARLETSGRYVLRAQFGSCSNSWPIWVSDPLDITSCTSWGKHDPAGLLADLKLKGEQDVFCTSMPSDLRDWVREGKKVLLFLREDGTVPMPFWRESAYEFSGTEFWTALGWHKGWEPFLDIAPDRALDPAWIETLGPHVEVLMNRVDVRTYKEHPILIRAGNLVATTLRPFGGLGVQPAGITRNPAGSHLLRQLIKLVSRD